MNGQRGLDWHNFFVANVQTGFGPFIAVYLASEAWTQRDIGTALSVGTIAAMASQLPAGALVDSLRNKRLAAFVACLAIAASALILALWPEPAPVTLAELLHGFASTMLAAAIAAMSLALVGWKALGERLGRNARYGAAGSAIAAGVMGAVGSWVSEAAVFYLTAGLMLPAMATLLAIPPGRAQLAVPKPAGRAGWREIRRVLLFGPALVFTFCVLLFHLGNAAMLPLVAGELTKTLGSRAGLVIAACIVLPQLVVAAASPLVGRAADHVGRRRVLLLSFLAVPVRGALLALVRDPVGIVLVQTLDGISAAGFGVMLPLVAADVTRGTQRFNLCMGLFGLAAGLGATVSTSLGGALADSYGNPVALLGLAAAGLASVLLVLTLMPETREIQAGAPA
ncbi:MAG TPA: MFS transporter [Acetobacteraceae bacterium]|nr:MFS transporter [Acetobacteraceae bacterium]